MVRGMIAVMLAVFAVAFIPETPVIGITAAVIAIGIGAMAVTGFCPTDWLSIRAEQRIPVNSLGYADARATLDLDTLSDEPSL